jgi:hypothetical protein
MRGGGREDGGRSGCPGEFRCSSRRAETRSMPTHTDTTELERRLEAHLLIARKIRTTR